MAIMVNSDLGAGGSERVIVLDLGGTIGDFHRIAEECLVEIGIGSPRTISEKICGLSIDPQPWKFSYLFLSEYTLSQLATGSINTSDILEKYRDEVRLRLRKLRPRLERIFSDLAINNYHLVVATNGTIEATNCILKETGLFGYVEGVYTSEQFRNLKKGGQLHRAIAEEYQEYPQVMLGNSIEEDILPALESNMEAILSTEYQCSSSIELLVPAGVKIIQSLEQLKSTAAHNNS